MNIINQQPDQDKWNKDDFASSLLQMIMEEVNMHLLPSDEDDNDDDTTITITNPLMQVFLMVLEKVITEYESLLQHVMQHIDTLQ